MRKTIFFFMMVFMVLSVSFLCHAQVVAVSPDEKTVLQNQKPLIRYTLDSYADEKRLVELKEKRLLEYKQRLSVQEAAAKVSSSGGSADRERDNDLAYLRKHYRARLNEVKDDIVRIESIKNKQTLIGVKPEVLDKVKAKKEEMTKLLERAEITKDKMSQIELLERVHVMQKELDAVPIVESVKKYDERRKTDVAVIDKILKNKIKEESKDKIKELKKKKLSQFRKRKEVVRVVDRQNFEKAAAGTERLRNKVKTLISIQLDASDEIRKDVEVVEIIPKSYAQTVSEVEFSIEPSEILEDDPIVKWNFDVIPAGEEVTIEYAVEGEKEEDTETLAAEGEEEQDILDESDVEPEGSAEEEIFPEIEHYDAEPQDKPVQVSQKGRSKKVGIALAAGLLVFVLIIGFVFARKSRKE